MAVTVASGCESWPLVVGRCHRPLPASGPTAAASQATGAHNKVNRTSQTISRAQAPLQQGRLEGERAAMTAAQQLIEEGMEQGLEKGRAGATLQRLLSAKFGSLSSQHYARIQAAPIDTLFTWIERVSTAQTLNDVFDS